jgi:N-acetylmuramoyl-L-alanine amidase
MKKAVFFLLVAINPSFSEEITLFFQNRFIVSSFIPEGELLAASEVASIIDATLSWNPIIDEAKLSKDDVSCTFWIEKKRVILDKREILLKTPPKLISGKLFVPIELIKAFCEKVKINLCVNRDRREILFVKEKVCPLPLANKRGVWHKVAKGETLWRLSKNYGVDLFLIANLNNIKDPTFIKAGERIFIPNPSFYEEKKETERPEEMVKIPSGIEEEGSPLKRFGIKRIVIDPGHGGKDPGAIGRGGLREKDVVLKIAKELSKAIKRKTGVEVILTRDDDYYVPLAKRTALANYKKADLFISIHANASFSRKVSGFEVYHLSATASDREAKEMAEAENEPIKFEGEELTDYTKFILADIAQQEFIDEAIELSILIQEKVKERLNVKTRGIKSAFFYVLKDALMPAVLIETGFLSNFYEERKLRERGFIKRLTEAIAEAVFEYKNSYEKALSG